MPDVGPALLYNGTIHSTAEPYAEAMLVENGQVAWLGSDETAERLTGDDYQRQDLDRALVAPAFVGISDLETDQFTAEAVATVLDTAAGSLGYSTLRLRLPVHVDQLGDETLEDALRDVLTRAETHPVEVFPVIKLAGVEADGGAPSIAPVNQALDLIDSVAEASSHPIALEIKLADVLPNLLGVRSWAAEAGRQLLIETAGVAAADVVDAVVTTQAHLRDLKQTPSPATPTVLIGFDSAAEEHWQQLLNTGCHVVLTGPGHLATALRIGVPTAAAPAAGELPWQLIAAHVHHEQDPVSVRAGFNAQVRGAYRGLPGASPEQGQLNPGSTATYAVWEVESLAVQTPNSTVAAWSTDTRARTPLLPYLESPASQERLPRLVSTVISGKRL